MNILFNASRCGLGPNGGSKTIVKSAEVLQRLGHDVDIWSPIHNYTWHTPTIAILTYLDYGNYDDLYDVVVNVSILDVGSTLKLPIKNKVWWLRGWETWVRGEQYLIDQVKKFVAAGGRMVVNSSWLINQLKNKCGVDSQLCYSGLDLDFWKTEGDKNFPITIGALWHPKHKTKNYHIFEEVKEKCSKHKSWVFKTLRNDLNDIQLREFYRECTIWLSLSENEGFHQCPAEAALCGCHIIYNDVDSGGTRDYCTPETAHPFKTVSQLISTLEGFSWSKRDKMEAVLVGKIGSREKNMVKFVKVLAG